MSKRTIIGDLDLRQTLEYAEATYWLQAKTYAYEQLQSINKELNILNRLSHDAVTLAKRDLQDRLSDTGCDCNGDGLSF
jgi:hypothetical protein